MNGMSRECHLLMMQAAAPHQTYSKSDAVSSATKDEFREAECDEGFWEMPVEAGRGRHGGGGCRSVLRRAHILAVDSHCSLSGLHRG